MLNIHQLRPHQALVASLFFNHKRLMVSLPRQYGGKTELGVRFLHDLTARPFTSTSLFLAKDHNSAKKATREKFLRIFDKDKFKVNTAEVVLKSCPTSSILMGSVDKDPDRQRGGTYSMIHWSEVAFSKIEQGQTIAHVFDTVINPTLTQTDGYVYLESTNNGKNGWYDLWNDAETYGFKTLKLSLSDLVYLGVITPEEYEKVKATTHPDVFRQEYECEWVTFQGKTYEEFDEKIHVDAEIGPPEDWQVTVMGIDWGYHPSATCVLFAYVLDGVLYVFDEHYKTRELAAKTAIAIENKVEEWHIDQFAATADHEEDRIEELNLRGIPCGKANKVNMLGARMSIKELLWANKLKIHPRCKNLIRDLQAATWHDKKEGDLNYEQCTWGHFDAEAALRYLVRELSKFERIRPDKNPFVGVDDMAAWAWKLRKENELRYA